MIPAVEPGASSGLAPGPPLGTSRAGRIIGLDLARAVAMVGMVTVHYLLPDNSGSLVDQLVKALQGRSMPLFMMLGGIGVTLASRRATTPDRDLLVRAVLLFALGIAINERNEWLAVVLPAYGLFFALAPLARRLPNAVLLATTAGVAAAGAWTFQVLGTFPRQEVGWDQRTDPELVISALVFDGFYPLFPVAAFFLLGIWLGRLDLRSQRLAATLTVAGAGVGVASLVVGAIVATGFGVDQASLEELYRVPNESGFDPERFHWERLLHARGHRQMPVWVLSAAGTSVAVIGMSLLVAPRLGRAMAAPMALGRTALTFYVLQVALTKEVTPPWETDFGQEARFVATLVVGYTAVAWLWLRFLPAGPLEFVLRLANGRRTRQPPPSRPDRGEGDEPD